jgi:hypothetical protein
MPRIVEPLRPASCRREALFADPLLRRDLLLIALAWDHLLDTKPKRVIELRQVARMVGVPGREMLRLLVADIPRYEPPTEPESCQYIGPRGGRCHRRKWTSHPLLDVDDGTITWVSACYDSTHRAWADRLAMLHDDALDTRTPPKPVYNTRSRMAHHFDDVIDFPAWWVTLTTAKADQESAWPTNQETVYDIARDPERGGCLLIQRPRLRIVS